jgi:serine/threonine protein kinase
MANSISNVCPDNDMLKGYITGRLEEDSAIALSSHLESCDNCQSKIDQFEQRPDTIVRALQRPVSEGSDADQRAVAKLMAGVLDGDSVAISSDKTATPKGPVSPGRFIEALRRSQLVEENQLDAILEILDQSKTSHLAQQLVQRNFITQFQAKALMRGKWKGLVIGGYVVMESLGEGGMGKVFKAKHRTMGRIICLKVLNRQGRKSPEIVERFQREARTIGALQHPNIVVAHDAGEEDGIPFLVMEYIQGIDLAKRVRKTGPLEIEMVRNIILKTAQALEYAHSSGVIHRDIKPHNLILDDEGKLTILDMGLARIASDPDEPSDVTTFASMTSSGAIMGTVDYMAPEQAMNSRKADHRADIYSLGCTMHFLLTAQPVFEGETVMEKLIAHREESLPKLNDRNREVSNGLNAIFHKMLAKNSADRYQSMAEVVADLEADAAGKQPTALLEIQTSNRRMATSAYMFPVAVASSLFLATVLIAFAVSSFIGQTEPEPISPIAKGPGNSEVPAVPPTEPPVETPGGRPDSPPVEPPTAPAPVKLKRNVMVVVPNFGFDPVAYKTLTHALDKHGVKYVTAALNKGKAISSDPKAHGNLHVKSSMYDYQSKHYDGIFFCGGEMTDLFPEDVQERARIEKC